MLSATASHKVIIPRWRILCEAGKWTEGICMGCYVSPGRSDRIRTVGYGGGFKIERRNDSGYTGITGLKST